MRRATVTAACVPPQPFRIDDAQAGDDDGVSQRAFAGSRDACCKNLSRTILLNLLGPDRVASSARISCQRIRRFSGVGSRSMAQEIGN